MLKWRLVSSAVIVSGLLLLLHLDYHHPLLGGSGIWLLPLALFGSVMMSFELLDLWRGRPDRPIAWAVYVGAPCVVLGAALPIGMVMVTDSESTIGSSTLLGGTAIAFVLSIGLVFVAEMKRFQEPGTSTQRVGLSILAICYAGLLISFLVSLRLLGGHEIGMLALVSMVVIVKVSDTGAYFTGRLIGRQKLAPVLSPGKTVQGAVGGTVSACVASWAIFYLILPRVWEGAPAMGPWWGWIVYGLLLTAAGITGDLAESLLKRDAKRKDSSTWLPGLGGVLDILDSIVFAAPVAFICWAIGLIGPKMGF